MLPGITAFVEFFHAAGSSLLNRCVFTGTLCMSSLMDQSRLICWKQMYISHTEKNLSILSCFTLNRSAATGSQPLWYNYVDVSVNSIKNSIWAAFAAHVLQSL